jgi:catechol 2,3-dioxygenase-like lactoylglutathione lyase family enzyme
MEMEWAKLVPELYVTNIKDTLDFYIETLGFEMKYGRPEDGFAYLDKEGAQIMVEEINQSDRTWITGDLEKPYGRGINFQIEIADVDGLYQKIRDMNYPLFMEIEEKWYRTGDIMGGNRQFLVQDPDGYLLRFFTHLGDKPIKE